MCETGTQTDRQTARRTTTQTNETKTIDAYKIKIVCSGTFIENNNFVTKSVAVGFVLMAIPVYLLHVVINYKFVLLF